MTYIIAKGGLFSRPKQQLVLTKLSSIFTFNKLNKMLRFTVTHTHTHPYRSFTRATNKIKLIMIITITNRL